MREIIMEETQEGHWKPETYISRLKRFMMPWRTNSERKELDPGDAWVRFKIWSGAIAILFYALLAWGVSHQ